MEFKTTIQKSGFVEKDGINFIFNYGKKKPKSIFVSKKDIEQSKNFVIVFFSDFAMKITIPKKAITETKKVGSTGNTYFEYHISKEISELVF